MKRVSILDFCLLGYDVCSWPHQNCIAWKYEYVAHHHHRRRRQCDFDIIKCNVTW